MSPIALILLAVLTLFVFAYKPLIAVILGGLLVVILSLVSKINDLNEKTTKQQNIIAKIKARLARLEEEVNLRPLDETLSEEEDVSVTQRTENTRQLYPNINVETEDVVRDDASANQSPIALKQESDANKAIELEASAVVAERMRSDVDEQQSDASWSDPGKPTKPAEPSFIEKALKAAWNWFTDGNIFVRVGIIILFMGMTFLIRYAIGKNILPIEVRLLGVSAVAIALLYWGWRQREKREAFALVVQGGGIGLLYLTIFAGFSLYKVIPSGLAFVLLAMIVLLAAMLAILQDAKPLALFATVGGFLAPVLTSSGSNNYIGLFSYYAILNLGIFTIAWFKSWRILNFVGFVFTFAISTVWGILSYQPEYFSTTEPFLILFFLMYVAIGVLFARNRNEFYKDYVDSSVIFGTPLLAFGLQCAMVKDFEYGIAISAFGLAAFYLALTQYLWKKYSDDLRLLVETFISLGVIFATLAIPFAIDGTLTGATWAIEGAGILWISISQEQKYRRLFAIALVFAAGVILASELMLPLGESQHISTHAFINSSFIGCVIIVIAASSSSWLLSRNYPGKLDFEKTMSVALLAYGLFVLFAGFEYQINYFELYSSHGILLAVLSAVCALAFTIVGNCLEWGRARWVSLLMLAPIAVAAVLCYAYQEQLSMHYGYLVWPLCLLIYFFGLKHSLTIIPKKSLLVAHTMAAVIIIGLLFWDGLWQLLLCYSLLAILFNYLAVNRDWPQLKLLALGFLPVLVLCAISAIRIDGNLIDLSSISSGIAWPFPTGYVLWPFGFVVYFYLLRQNPKIGDYSTSNMHYSAAVLIYSLLLWLGAWPLLLGGLLLSLLCCVLWQRYTWQEMYMTSLALLPIMWLITFINLMDGSFHSFYLREYNLNIETNIELGYVLWPLAFSSLFWCYKQYDKHKQSPLPAFQSLAVILPVLLVTWEASWHILDYVDFMNAWHLAWLPLSSMLTIALIMTLKIWPFSVHRNSYQRLALPMLIMAPLAWSILQLTSSANSIPLPWIPLLNPVDIIQTVIILGVLMWSDDILSALNLSTEKRFVNNSLLAFIFLWMNVELLRAVHYWAGIPWEMSIILSDDISQTSLSLFWALTGLLVALYSSRKKKRTLWIIGASLLGVVVLKLFIIDLSARETIERIVSFTGVGMLLMLVGYFSPLPPKIKVESNEV